VNNQGLQGDPTTVMSPLSALGRLTPYFCTLVVFGSLIPHFTSAN